MNGRLSSRALQHGAAALLAALSCACQRQASRPACPPGQACLEYGNTVDPNTLDPAKATLTNESAILGELLQGLTQNDADSDPIPGMATNWETSADGLTWTFHLRDAQWSDGTAVTADDFVFAYRRVLDPATASSYAYLLYVLKNGQAVNEHKAATASLGAAALDARTLRLTLAHPAPYLPQILAHQSFYPVPAHVVRRWGDDWTKPGRFVGNGPFNLVRWRLGDYLRVERNPLYWDARRVRIDRIDFYPTTDAVSAERRVERGELDVNDLIQSSRIDHLRRPGGMAAYVRTYPYLGTYYLTFNVRHVPALRDLRVRQAISMAIDRDFIAGKLLRAGQTATTAFVPPRTAGYLPPAAAHPRARWASMTLAARQAEARRLLGAVGYSEQRPLRIELKSPNSNSAMLVTQAIQADLQAVGVRATLAQEEGQVLYQSLAAGDFQIGYVSWIADYNDPLTFLALMRSDTGAQNYGGYRNARFDALMDQADHTGDARTRGQFLAGAEQVMLDDAYIAPLYVGVNTNLVNPRVRGWRDNAADIHRAQYLSLAGP